jgi:hypothetical protein
MVSSHNFRDPKGRVVCPIFLKKLKNNRCGLCDQTGHFADKCPKPSAKHVVAQKESIKPVNKVHVKETKPVKKVGLNQWDVLGQDSSSDEDEEEFAKVAPNVTVRSKVKASQLNWADMSDDDDEEGDWPDAPWAKK